jgi:hypothetical protein
MLLWSVGLLENLTSGVPDTKSSSINSLTVLVVAVALSSLLGHVGLSIGAYSLGTGYERKDLVKLGHRVSKLDSALVTQFYVDAINKVEVAAGFRGTALFGFLAILLRFLSDLPKISSDPNTVPMAAKLTAIVIAIAVMEGSRSMAKHDLKAVEDLMNETEVS